MVKVKFFKAIAPFVLALLYLLLLFYRAERVAITDDAKYYMGAASKYSDYLENGWKKFRYFDKKFIDSHWKWNREHPPFAKLVMASGYLLLHKKTGLMKRSVAFRAGISLLAVVMLLFLFDFVRRSFSFEAAIFASLFFIFLPRTFFHARVATLDFTVGATSFMFVYSYYRGLSSKYWGWITGVMFGIALSSKLNAPLMVFPVAIHFLFVKWKVLRQRPFTIFKEPIFLSMLLISLPLFFAIWPWLWFDTVPRFTNYLLFHLKHYNLPIYYLGERYFEERPPFYAAFIMMVVTTPLMTLLFAFLSPVSYRREGRDVTDSPMLLTLLSAFAALGTVIFIPAPFYSGVKLFQPFFPFLAVLAGVGLWSVLRGVSSIPEKYRYAPFIIFFIPILLGFFNLKQDHISYYSGLVGGTKGAMKHGFERHYYDLFYLEMADFFNSECKDAPCKVKVMVNPKEYRYTSKILKRSGLLTKNYRHTEKKAADFYVLIHEYRLANYPIFYKKYKKMIPVKEIRREGVPLVTIYRKDGLKK